MLDALGFIASIQSPQISVRILEALSDYAGLSWEYFRVSYTRVVIEVVAFEKDRRDGLNPKPCWIGFIIVGAAGASEGSPGASGTSASTAAASAAEAASVKTRLRWTPELHEKFVDAVAQLGGSERK